MEIKYRPDDYESKLIVLYTISNLKKSPSYTILSQIISASVDINYFEVQGIISELMEIKSVEENQIDGETVYTLTNAGAETSEFFFERISASVREKILTACNNINGDKTNENRVYADYIPINETEYKVKCGVTENNTKLLDFEMYAGSKERAKKICEYFKENTMDFYTCIISHIESNI